MFRLRSRFAALLGFSVAGLLLVPNASNAQDWSDYHEGRYNYQNPWFDPSLFGSFTYKHYAPNPGTGAKAATKPRCVSATVTLHVPDPHAEVWFGNHKTRQTGSVRIYATAPLNPSAENIYTVRVRWMENGKAREETRQVHVDAGKSVVVDFSAEISN